MPEIEHLINETIQKMIEKSSAPEQLNKIAKKHNKKVRFIPKRYRILGGILQSMNIQFGNFIEELMAAIIKADGKFRIIEKYSGKKSNSFKISALNEELIDNYIVKCQTENININTAFPKLLSKIIENDMEETISFKHDIDLLFQNKDTNVYYYLEIKYNDDHDTGKFVDINRKFIKTTAYLLKALNIKKIEDFKPIIYYFTPKKMKGNIYVPENDNIYRGKQLFDELLKTKYEDISEILTNISEKPAIIKAFDELYAKITKEG